MLKELLQDIWAKAQYAAAPYTLCVEGRTYSDRPLNCVSKAPFPAIKVHTLSGLFAYIAANKDKLDLDTCALVVHDHTAVQLRSSYASRTDGGRCVHVEATLIAADPFPYGKFLDIEEFVIQAQSKFVESHDRARLLKLVGNLTSGALTTQSDDGVTQQVTVRAGVTLVGRESIGNPFELAPFRTFPEIDQPESPFILRVEDKSGAPRAALFEADGGAWKTEAIKKIGKLLSCTQSMVTVLA